MSTDANPIGMSHRDLCEIVGDITFRTWRFVTSPIGQGFLLQVIFFTDAEDFTAAIYEKQRGRKWYISRFSTKSEVVRTALKAVLTAVEHEAREDFHFRESRVFGPHIDVDALIEICSRKDARDDRRSG